VFATASPAKWDTLERLGLDRDRIASSREVAFRDSFLEATGREGVDVGLAVATDRGLLVPVLRRTHERSLGELAAERVRLVDAARAGRLGLDEMSGATITISNLGGFGIDSFTAMLNPGESAILAVGRPLERVVPRDRSLTVVTTISLSLTIDHRVMDGASGARALVELADLLEGAMTWRT